MKHKKLFVSVTVIFSVIIFFAVFLMIWYFGDNYNDFEAFRQEFEIPGLDEGAVPQGMTSCVAKYYDNEDVENKDPKTQQYFFISAYMKDGSPSRIYVTAEKTGYVGYVTMKTEEGKDFYGHCGGIAINNNTTSYNLTQKDTQGYTLWVTGESMVYCAKSSEDFSKDSRTIAQEIIEKAEARTKGDTSITDDYSIQFTSSFKANCNASFCYYFDAPNSSGVSSDRLYVGEFYRKGNFETDKSHWLTTPEGYQNTAFMYEYNVNSSYDNKYGLYRLLDSTSEINGLREEDNVPKIQKIFSLPEGIQGVAYSGKSTNSSTDGMLILSQSYGLSNSHLLCFDFKTISDTRQSYTKITGGSGFEYEGVLKDLGSEIKPQYTEDPYVYYVDKNNADMFVNDYSIPSMSEALCVLTPASSNNGAMNRVYVLFESACKKYNVFVRQQIKNVYSFNPKPR